MLPLDDFLRRSLLDSRRLEIRLRGDGPSLVLATLEAELITVHARRVYRSLGGQDLIGSVERDEGEGCVVLRLIPHDDPPED
jgi:hypothetical protein